MLARRTCRSVGSSMASYSAASSVLRSTRMSQGGVVGGGSERDFVGDDGAVGAGVESQSTIRQLPYSKVTQVHLPPPPLKRGSEPNRRDRRIDLQKLSYSRRSCGPFIFSKARFERPTLPRSPGFSFVPFRCFLHLVVGTFPRSSSVSSVSQEKADRTSGTSLEADRVSAADEARGLSEDEANVRPELERGRIVSRTMCLTCPTQSSTRQ